MYFKEVVLNYAVHYYKALCTKPIDQTMSGNYPNIQDQCYYRILIINPLDNNLNPIEYGAINNN